ncbi:LolA family protein [Rathayibacter tritici]|uniref:DUF2092 domain-containing protein n=1 Tax=Rathayibacter tritici TaxID=33888 RepID=A0A160KS85_9MICO|nr:hypothetical protein [Rathayibacter tritici]AND16219.1 hypothetical protein A6122_1070 [Rathayibacter tritici]PPF31285.1 DUF2092 domain-containing protein [Rathayibacter tritici]PPI12644.1 DUF2092 domain-containing protein [Rathayibacter tritici]PPI42785.1 DUF2092 domain-containing protein [Rathayibacter tritici]
MSIDWKRWTPVVVVPAVVVAAAVALPLSASAAGDLPEKSAADLLAFVAESDATAFSGEIQQSSDLGLPDLSALGGSTGATSGSADPIDALVEMATGSHQARVYVDSEQGARLQVLDRLAERDVIASKTDGVWVYDSGANTATHHSPPSGAVHEGTPSDQVLTPSSAAEHLLAAIDPTTSVAVGSDVRVAGRDAYELVLTPRDSGTLVGSVSVSVDGQTGLPLGVTVTARGGTAPAFSLAYTSIDFSRPDASLFTFTPPAGAQVSENAAPVDDATDVPAAETPSTDAPDSVTPGDADVTTTGSGWGTVVELPAGNPAGLGSLEAITTRVDGGRVLSSALLTVLLTEDGRVLAGAVTVETLRDAAAAR